MSGGASLPAADGPNVAAALFEKARRALAASRRELEAGDAEASINRAYYAAFHAASAALWHGGHAHKTHAGAQALFAEHLVRTGRVPPEVGRTLRHAARLREHADYDAATVYDEAAASDLLRDVEAFVAAIEAAVRPGA